MPKVQLRFIFITTVSCNYNCVVYPRALGRDVNGWISFCSTLKMQQC